MWTNIKARPIEHQRIVLSSPKAGRSASAASLDAPPKFLFLQELILSGGFAGGPG
jgi:hypothetical protein